MRKVQLRNNTTIESPWMRIEEAAAYCGLSRAAFDDHADRIGLPYNGLKSARTYHVKTLDYFMQIVAEIEDAQEKYGKGSRHAQLRMPKHIMALINPRTGQMFVAPKAE
ncbi:MAG: hypothetical protein JXB42_12755 [Deltaproteobacteria bacterium]|nr:hypothetical protein [Deltaproteobacteria bacterium]